MVFVTDSCVNKCYSNPTDVRIMYSTFIFVSSYKTN